MDIQKETEQSEHSRDAETFVPLQIEEASEQCLRDNFAKDGAPSGPSGDVAQFLEQLGGEHLAQFKENWAQLKTVLSDPDFRAELWSAFTEWSIPHDALKRLAPFAAIIALLIVVSLLAFGSVVEVVWWEMTPSSTGNSVLPYYDLVALIYATASEQDLLRMREASSSWLQWNSSAMTFFFVFAICTDDPGRWRVEGEPNVAIVPCEHGYRTLSTKGIEGYRYLSMNFGYKYVLKADIDTVVPMDCVEKGLQAVSTGKMGADCPSFGLGRWYAPRASKVVTADDPLYGTRFHNEEFLQDTGADYYFPYMSGWAIIWSADVAQMLGMFGHSQPRWRRTWAIDDAAIGAFIVGLDICRLELPCETASDVEGKDVRRHSAALSGQITDAAASTEEALVPGPDGTIEGFEGPLADDVPGLGDVMNVHASSLGNCAMRCIGLSKCRSFEYSPTVGLFDHVRSCQLATGVQRGGVQYKDFKLYIRKT